MTSLPQHTRFIDMNGVHRVVRGEAVRADVCGLRPPTTLAHMAMVRSGDGIAGTGYHATMRRTRRISIGEMTSPLISLICCFTLTYSLIRCCPPADSRVEMGFRRVQTLHDDDTLWVQLVASQLSFRKRSGLQL